MLDRDNFVVDIYKYIDGRKLGVRLELDKLEKLPHKLKEVSKSFRTFKKEQEKMEAELLVQPAITENVA